MLYKAVDFFCGCGGMTYGLQQSGVKVIAGIDLNLECKETYETNNKGSKFINADIKELNLKYLEEKLRVKRNDDKMIFVGCSPCQFYSIINTNKEKSKHSKGLLMDFMKFVKYYNPGFVLVENVPGILSNKESVFEDFKCALSKMGYNKIEYDIINMSYYGVPQSRKRFSLIASRVNKNITLPQRDDKQSLLKDYIGEKNDFKKIKAGHRDNTDFMHTVPNLSSTNLKRLDKTPRNGGNRLAWKNDKELQLKCFKNKDNSFKDTFGRMWWNRPAPTITTKFFSISNGRFAHPEENRPLSLREGATVQTFPRDYIFKTKSIQATAKLIGNAVPPEYARRLGEVIVTGK
jgi:DNA (cytosine-5)-methyltransferase 1